MAPTLTELILQERVDHTVDMQNTSWMLDLLTDSFVFLSFFPATLFSSTLHNLLGALDENVTWNCFPHPLQGVRHFPKPCVAALPTLAGYGLEGRFWRRRPNEPGTEL